MSEDVRKRELAPLQSIRDNYEKPCCPLSLVLMLLTTVSNPKTLSTGCLTNKHCIFKGNLKFFVVHVWNICELNTFGVANRHNWRFKASVHMSRCFSFAHIEEEWYICGAVQIQGQASKLHGVQQHCLFMGGTTSGKKVTEWSVMPMTAVYFCVRILSQDYQSIYTNR